MHFNLFEPDNLNLEEQLNKRVSVKKQKVLKKTKFLGKLMRMHTGTDSNRAVLSEIKDHARIYSDELEKA